jgi:ribosomal protein S6
MVLTKIASAKKVCVHAALHEGTRDLVYPVTSTLRAYFVLMDVADNLIDNEFERNETSESTLCELITYT